MADIDVVPKRGTNVWLWVILAIVAAVIVFALLGAFSGHNRVGHLMDQRPTMSTPALIDAGTA